MVSAKGLSRRAAIVGVGTTRFGEQYRQTEADVTAYDYAVDAFCAALSDSGLARTDIDGVIAARLPSYERLATLIGLRHPRLVNVYEGTGRMSGVILQDAVRAVTTGAATTVACIYGNNGRSAGATYGGSRSDPRAAATNSIYDEMQGMTSPGAYVALMWRRYQHLYGAPDGALASVAINNRANAAKNPNAVMRSPITFDDYISSRYIAEPLRLYDYCLINDGGVAFIVTTEDRARDLLKPPVYVSGIAASADLSNYYTSPDFFFTAARSAAKDLYEQCGIGPEEVDCLHAYDNFTPVVMFTLEGLGYCGQGEAWEWIEGGRRISLDGDLPTNTSGGHTSESYMQGWALHVEAVRQVRGECGDRQVPNCTTAQYACLSPVVTTHILQSDR
jgi:acetyl-CoA acetyltransferase